MAVTKRNDSPASSTGQAESGASRKRLGDLLVVAGIITEEQLRDALERKKRDPGFLGKHLVNAGHIDQKTLISFLAKQCKIPHLNLLDYNVDAKLLQYVPRESCLRHRVLPIDKLGKILTLAMVDPLDLDALTEVRAHCPELRLKPILCSWQHFDEVANRILRDDGEDGDNATATMQSFGFATSGSKPAPKAQTPPAPSKERPAQTDPADDISEEAVANAVNGLIEEVESQRTEAAAKEPSASRSESKDTEARAPNVPAGADIAQTASHIVGQALQSLVRHARQTPQVSEAELEQALHRGLQDAVDQTGSPQAGTEERALQEAVRKSVEEALSKALPDLSAALCAPAAPSTGLSKELQEGIASAVKAAMSQISADQETRAVAAQNEADLTHPDAVAPRNHKAVIGFGKGKDGALSALDSMDADERVLSGLETAHPLAGFTFDTFHAGKANRFTFELAKAVAAQPGQAYNPFFLHGNVGLGKTHLVNAIGNTIAENTPDLRVGYVSASHFARRLKEAGEDGRVDQFRESYCHWDVLILDDIQFL